MKKPLILILTGAIAVSLFAGCGNSSPGQQPAESQTSDATSNADTYAIEVLKLISEGDFGGPNPFRHSTRGPGSTKMRHVYDSLLECGPDGYIPWLAEDWSLSDDGLEYTFKIHDGATWHDGTPVTANDVGFSIDYYSVHPNSGGNLFTADSSIVSSYDIVDDLTIKIRATEALATNTENIGTLPIIPEHIWKDVEDPYNYEGDGMYTGCGMYKFVSYDSAAGTYQFEAYDDYYGHQAGAHFIDYAPVSDDILAFENGDVAICDISADLYDAYAARDDIKIRPKNDEMGFRLMLNMDKVDAFKDVEVRKAIYNALDRESMVKSVFQGLGHVASAGYVPQTNPFYTDDVVKYDYDAEAAKAVLEPLGLKLKLIIGQDTPAEATLGEIIKMNLEAAGIDVDVESYDVGTRDSIASSGDYDLLLTYHGGWNAEPLSMLRAIYGAKAGGGSKWANFGYENADLAKILGSMASILDTKERGEAYKQAQIIISETVPNMPLITQVSYAINRPAEYDCWQAPFNSTQFENSRLSYTADKSFD